jgi:hypothetical protein
MDNLLLFDGALSGGILGGTVINTAWANPPTTTTYYSANVIDVSQIASSASGYGRDIGIGDDPALLVVVMAPIAICGSSGSSTLQVSIQAAPDSSGSPGTYVTLASSPVYTAGASSPYTVLAAGQEALRIPMPVADPASLIPKFYRIAYTIAGAALATSGTGTVVATLVLDRQALGPLSGYRSGYSNQYV